MNHPPADELLGQGRFLRLVRREGWEFVERVRPVRSVFIGGITTQGCLVITEEYRIPVGRWVVGFPAGLVGDEAGAEGESLETAVRRELREEVGFDAAKVTWLTEGPTSAGQTDEVIAIVLAEGLTRIGAGGGIGPEQIRHYEVPLAQVHGWLAERQRRGMLIDPKVYTLLYFVDQRNRLPAVLDSSSRGE
jgi:ADP-ribose pyrophosphatase